MSAHRKVTCTFDICPVPGIGLRRSLQYAAQPVYISNCCLLSTSLRATITFYVQIYERDVMFRQQVGNLQLIVGIYNDVQATILPVEKPLITQKLEAVDAALKKGLQVNVFESCIRDNKRCQLQANSGTMQYSASSPACSHCNPLAQQQPIDALRCKLTWVPPCAGMHICMLYAY